MDTLVAKWSRVWGRGPVDRGAANLAFRGMAAGQVLPPISRAMLAAGLASIPNAAGLGFDTIEPSFV